MSLFTLGEAVQYVKAMIKGGKIRSGNKYGAPKLPESTSDNTHIFFLVGALFFYKIY